MIKYFERFKIKIMEFSFLSKHKSPVFKINLKDNKSSSSEDKCPICLVIPIEDKSFADKCLHAFCKVNFIKILIGLID